MSAADVRPTNQHIEQVWDRFVVLARKAGRSDAADWMLFDGDPDVNPRVPWSVKDGSGQHLLTLGYTRRDAMTALLTATSVLAIVFGA